MPCGCCGGGRSSRKVYAEEQQAAEARVQAAIAARREVKQGGAPEKRRGSISGGGSGGGSRANARRHSVQGPATSGRRASIGAETRRLSDSKAIVGASARRGSLNNQLKAPASQGRRGSLGASGGAVLQTQGYGAASARRRSGADTRDGAPRRGSVSGGRRGSSDATSPAYARVSSSSYPSGQVRADLSSKSASRHRRWSVESRSPLSPVVESPANRGLALSLAGPEEEDEDAPLIARTRRGGGARGGGGGGGGGLVRTRSGSQPDALSPKMRGTGGGGGGSSSSSKKNTMDMLLMMDNVNINDLHKAGTTLDELLLMGFGSKTLAAIRTPPSGQVEPVFPLRAIKKCYKIDRRWLAEKVGMDANLFSRTANSAVDYEAVGIDASWLLINGLDAGCMRRFGDCISLSDWVTKLGLEQSIARKIGLSGRDFMSLGWDYSSLIKSLDYTPRQVRKRHFLSHLYIKMMFLPRQARDKHRENSKKNGVSL
jgi:hypothetical protein